MSFRDDLLNHIAAAGGIGVDAYMKRCNEQYYATRDPFGAAGDFITAPEITQMFGEMIAGWAVDLWMRAGQPTPVRLVELGPGRGTLMTDLMRAARTAPSFADAAEIHFVERSPVLRDAQKHAVPDAAHHDSFSDVPSGAPILLVANEFLDALPVRQEVQVDGEWQERKVVVVDGALAFAPQGEPVSDRRDADGLLLAEIAERVNADGGAALFIDYGYASGEGDTLQAVKNHERVGVLDMPGEVDLTAHVDFARLKDAAIAAGCEAHGAVTQAAFLNALGIGPRAELLIRGADERGRAQVRSGLKRLTDPHEMGALFKAFCLTAPGWPGPAGFPK